MADTAYSTTAPAAEPPTLRALRNMYVFADATRDVIHQQHLDDQLHAICDGLLARLIDGPVKSVRDITVKLWLIDLAGEREWDHHFCARPCIKQVERFVQGWRR